MAQRRPVRSSRVARVGGPVLLVLALVAIVSVAARGSTSSGSAAANAPGDTLLATIFSLLLLLAVAWVAISVFSVVRWREHEFSAPKRRNDIRAIATLLAFGFALALYVRERGWHLAFSPQQTPLDRSEGSAAPPGFDAGHPGYQFQFAWLPSSRRSCSRRSPSPRSSSRTAAPTRRPRTQSSRRSSRSRSTCRSTISVQRQIHGGR